MQLGLTGFNSQKFLLQKKIDLYLKIKEIK